MQKTCCKKIVFFFQRGVAQLFSLNNQQWKPYQKFLKNLFHVLIVEGHLLNHHQKDILKYVQRLQVCNNIGRNLILQNNEFRAQSLSNIFLLRYVCKFTYPPCIESNDFYTFQIKKPASRPRSRSVPAVPGTVHITFTSFTLLFILHSKLKSTCSYTV